MVSEPPFSMLRAAPRNRFGGYSAVESIPPDRIRPRRRRGQVVGPAEPGDRVEQHDHVVAQLDQPLGPLDGQLGDRGVVLRRPVEGGGDDLALDRALHVGDLFGPLVDEHDHQVALGVVARDRVGDRLQHHRLAGLRRRHDQRPLALADRHDQVDDPGGEDVRLGLQPQPLLRVQRGQLVELGPAAGLLRVHPVDRVQPDQRVVLVPPLLAVARAGRTAPVTASPRRSPYCLTCDIDDVDVVGAGQVAGGPHERVVVEHVEDAGHRHQDVVLADLRLGAAAGRRHGRLALAAAAPRSRNRLRRPRRPPSPSSSSRRRSARVAPAVVAVAALGPRSPPLAVGCARSVRCRSRGRRSLRRPRSRRSPVVALGPLAASVRSARSRCWSRSALLGRRVAAARHGRLARPARPGRRARAPLGARSGRGGRSPGRRLAGALGTSVARAARRPLGGPARVAAAWHGGSAAGSPSTGSAGRDRAAWRPAAGAAGPPVPPARGPRRGSDLGRDAPRLGAAAPRPASARRAAAAAPAAWRSVIAVISSPLRIRAVPEMPRDAARLCSSGSSIAGQPGAAAATLAAVAVAGAVVSDVRDIRRHVGGVAQWIPSVDRPGPPGVCSRWPGGPRYTRFATSGAGVLQHGSSTVSPARRPSTGRSRRVRRSGRLRCGVCLGEA